MDTLALGTLSAGGLFAAILAWRMRGSAITSHTWQLQALIVAALLTLTINVRQRAIADADAITVDGQVAVRLIVYGLLILYAIRHNGAIWAMLRTRMGLWAAALVGVATISATWSLDATYSLVSAYSWIAMLGLAAVILARLTVTQAAQTFGVFTVVSAVLSFVTAALMPGVGWLQDIGDNLPRLQGLSGHPNAIGISMAVGAGIVTYLIRQGVWRGLPGYASLGVVSAALLASQSRTALAVAVVAGVFAFARRRWYTWIVIALGVIALIGYAPSAAFFSRGNGGEIANLNGRTDIWPFALQSWVAAPITGAGQGASRIVMAGFPNPDFKTTHPHSMYVNLLVTLGLLGAVPFAAFVISFFRRLALRDELSVYIITLLLLHGLTETSFLSAYGGPLLLLFFLASRRVA